MPCLPCKKKVGDVNGDVEEAGSSRRPSFLRRAKRYITNKLRSLCGRKDTRIHPLGVPETSQDSIASSCSTSESGAKSTSTVNVHLKGKFKRRLAKMKKKDKDFIHRTFRKKIQKCYRKTGLVWFESKREVPPNCVYVKTELGNADIFYTRAVFPPTVAPPRYITIEENMGNVTFPPRDPGRRDDNHEPQ